MAHRSDLSVGVLKEARGPSDSPTNVAVVASAVPTPRPTLYPKGPHFGPRLNAGNVDDRRWGFSRSATCWRHSAAAPAGGAALREVHHADGLCEDVSRSNATGPKARTSVLRFVDVFTRYHVQKEPADPRPICPLM